METLVANRHAGGAGRLRSWPNAVLPLATMRGTRAVAIFVAAVIAVELGTKFLLIRMLGSPAAAGVQGGS